MAMHKKKKRLVYKIWILFLVLAFLVILAMAAGLYFISKIQEIDSEPLKNVSVNEMSDAHIGDYTNIIIFGVDSRANDLRQNTRSDSIILASINKKTHDVTLTSLYRDTYVRIPEHGYTKINHAYSYGGPELAVNTINENFDLNVQDFITVNFSALSNVIDALGGIELKIQKKERKWVNAYARDVARINGTEYTKIKKAGRQTVTGVQATGYCRVRYTAGGDFTRAKRQRKVLKAIFAKMKKSSPVTLYRVMNEMLPQIYTSLSTRDILQLAKYLPFYEIKNSKGFPYRLDGHRASDGIFYDFPDTLTSNVTKLHANLFGTKNYKPSQTIQEIQTGMGY